MKLILIVAIFFFNISYCLPQTIERNDYVALIDSALSLDINYYSSFVDRKKATPIKVIYLIDENYNPIEFCKNNKHIEIGILNRDVKKDRKIYKKGISVWKVFFELNGNVINIKFLHTQATFERNMRNFSNGGGSVFSFEYSCDKKDWIIIDEKHFEN
jgi:hypothetical protein